MTMKGKVLLVIGAILVGTAAASADPASSPLRVKQTSEAILPLPEVAPVPWLSTVHPEVWNKLRVGSCEKTDALNAFPLPALRSDTRMSSNTGRDSSF